MRFLLINMSCVVSMCAISVSLTHAQTVNLSPGDSRSAKITINGAIGSEYVPPTCTLEQGASQARTIRLNENQVPVYNHYFGASGNIQTWSNRTNIGGPNGYKPEEREIELLFKCNNRPKEPLRLSLQPSDTSFSRYASSGYDYFIYADQMQNNVTSKKIGFVIMGNRFANGSDFLNVGDLQNNVKVPLKAITPATECQGIVGQTGYCTVPVTLAAMLVGADISTPLTQQYLPYQSWDLMDRYTLSMTVNVEYD